MKALLPILLAATGCATHKIDVASVPSGATISEVTESGQTLKLGKTPFTIDDKTDLDRRSLLLELPGYLPKQIMVIYPYQSKSRMVIFLTKTDDNWFKDVLELEHADKIDNVVTDLLRLQNVLVEGGDEAERLIPDFRKKYDRFSTYHTLVGVYYYQNGDMAKAKAAFDEAIRRNAGNKTARSMLQLLGSGKG